MVKIHMSSISSGGITKVILLAIIICNVIESKNESLYLKGTLELTDEGAKDLADVTNIDGLEDSGHKCSVKPTDVIFMVARTNEDPEFFKADYLGLLKDIVKQLHVGEKTGVSFILFGKTIMKNIDFQYDLNSALAAIDSFEVSSFDGNPDTELAVVAASEQIKQARTESRKRIVFWNSGMNYMYSSASVQEPDSRFYDHFKSNGWVKKLQKSTTNLKVMSIVVLSEATKKSMSRSEFKSLSSNHRALICCKLEKHAHCKRYQVSQPGTVRGQIIPKALRNICGTCHMKKSKDGKKSESNKEEKGADSSDVESGQSGSYEEEDASDKEQTSTTVESVDGDSIDNSTDMLEDNDGEDDKDATPTCSDEIQFIKQSVLKLAKSDTCNKNQLKKLKKSMIKILKKHIQRG